MALPISFRPSEDDVRNLAVLEATGLSRTDVIRRALADAARLQRRQQALRAEAAALSIDEADRCEIEQIRDFFGDPFGIAE